MPSRKLSPIEKIRQAFRNKTGARLTFKDVETLLNNKMVCMVIYPESRDYYQDQRQDQRVEVSAQEKEGEE